MTFLGPISKLRSQCKPNYTQNEDEMIPAGIYELISVVK